MAAAAHLSFPPEETQRDLRTLLLQTFGHRDFRPHQQQVCETAAQGRDVLLVMPTGAGKSLCYQLPALARGGTALVISPLIALMDDQAHKLTALNLRVARIHSGLAREDLREAARAYLEGRLDFLFIAPERLRVPGFPEMLAKRKPALVAIDEAHCISQWGHDFRPDYRTLGQFLPALRPSPIIALTATATPAVQQDILRALNLQDPAVFITGFRRTNLNIEVAETSKPQRLELMRKLLAPDTARPAIIYAQSRKAAEEIAGTLNGRYASAAYHAGLDPGTRDRVQRAFLSGKLDVVVATVAFGMGVDKADVRTVIHAALPGSVEAYYQEIGRAGRDGQPSRVVLLHSFADRRTLEFLLEKNYPPIPDVERVLTEIQTAPSTLEALQQRLKMERETVEQCIDKLLIQSAVIADLDGTVLANRSGDWKANYEQQVAYRRAQIDKIVAFAEGSTCRMAALIQHFGDRNDSGKPCGCCDICTPATTSAVDHHPATSQDKRDLRELLNAIPRDGRSIGKIFTDLGWTNRKRFHVFVSALAQAGLVSVIKDAFRSQEGEQVTYQKLVLTPEGRDADDGALNTVYLKDSSDDRSAGNSSSRSRAARTDTRVVGAKVKAHSTESLTPEQTQLEARLKAWRLAAARTNGIAAFIILHDSVLRCIAQSQPSSVRELEQIRGMGQDKMNRYGAAILAVCRNEETAADRKPDRSETHSMRAPQLTSAAAPGFVSERERSSLAKGRSAPVHPAAAINIPVSSKPHSSPLSSKDLGWPLSAAQQQIEANLRRWRSEQATAAGLPSFFVLSDTMVQQLARTPPHTPADLQGIAGLGAEKCERYGEALLALCRA